MATVEILRDDGRNASDVPEPIPAFDYRVGLKAQYREIMAAIKRVLKSGTLILGPEVSDFESEFARFVGCQYAVGTSSGTDALIVALRALGIGAGDEVMTVANGPVPTIAAIGAVGARARFADIDPHTLQMDAGQLLSALSPKTRCVVAIHLYGWPAPIVEIQDFCRRHGLALIEDCAQAHGTKIGETQAGLFGEIGCFSFYPTKNLGAFGDAGMCITNDAQLAEGLREQVCYGFRQDRIAHTEGLNCRLDELHAACLRVRLRHLPEAIERRRAIALRYYHALVETGLGLPPSPENPGVAWHQFVLRLQQREAWLDWFRQHRIGCNIHYATPIHFMPAYRNLGYDVGDLPQTEAACRQVLSLPIYPELTERQVDRVIEVIRLGLESGLT